MKQIFTLLISVFLITAVKAQDTLKSADLPSAGNTFVLSNGVAFTGMTPSSTGANYNWDYSQLTRSSQTLDTIFATSATNALLSFFFIDVSINTNRANQATKGADFNLGITGLTNVFNYYYNSTADYEQSGLGAVINSVPLPIAFTPHDVLYKFPLMYMNEDSDAYQYQVDLSTTVGFFYQVNRKRHNIVDGWGTLTTPFGTFNVERIKSTLIEQDSVYIDTFHLGTNTPPNTTFEYKWMAKGFGLPVLQINTTSADVVTQILYQDSIHLTGISEAPAMVNEPSVFPNPATDNIIIHYSLNRNENVRFNLIDPAGREVLSEENKMQSAGENFKVLNISGYNLSAGNYFVKVQAGNSVFMKKIQVAK